MSYTAILKDLMKRVKPDQLGVTFQEIRETRSKELLMELKCSKEGRRWLDTALKKVIGASGTVRGFFDHGSELELKISLRDHTEET